MSFPLSQFLDFLSVEGKVLDWLPCRQQHIVLVVVLIPVVVVLWILRFTLLATSLALLLLFDPVDEELIFASDEGLSHGHDLLDFGGSSFHCFKFC